MKKSIILLLLLSFVFVGSASDGGDKNQTCGPVLQWIFDFQRIVVVLFLGFSLPIIILSGILILAKKTKMKTLYGFKIEDYQRIVKILLLSYILLIIIYFVAPGIYEFFVKYTNPKIYQLCKDVWFIK